MPYAFLQASFKMLKHPHLLAFHTKFVLYPRNDRKRRELGRKCHRFLWLYHTFTSASFLMAVGSVSSQYVCSGGTRIRITLDNTLCRRKTIRIASNNTSRMWRSERIGENTTYRVLGSTTTNEGIMYWSLHNTFISELQNAWPRTTHALFG